MKKIIIALFAGLLLFNSCSTKRYVYLREDKEQTQDSTFYKLDKTNYYIQPGDILYISIHSILSETEGMFHFPGQGSSTLTGAAMQNNSMYLNQSVVDDMGFIRIPTLGMVYVAGSTVDEVEEVVQMEARKFVSDALARVKLVSYEISFIGEFNNPGKITFYKDRVHILDALAQAGEVSYYADRQHLRVMRQTEEGMYSYYIDLTDKNLMTDERFYLKPNDVVYAEPLPRKIFRINAADYALVLATITSTIATVALIVTLSK